MRPYRTAGGWPALLVVLGGLLAAAPTRAATVTCGTASGLAGQTVNVNITTSDLTGLSVRSFEFDLGYNASVVTATGVSIAGALPGTAGWATPTFNVTSGKIRVSAAGANVLAGAGTLLQVSFLINPALLNGSGTGLTLSNFVFNEGTPTATLVGGSITVNATPQITVSPNTGEIAKGQTLQFTAFGSVVNPVAWSTTNGLVASISASGLLTGLAPGTVRVNALDAAAHGDQSDGDINIRVAAVTIGNGSTPAGTSISIPVSTTSLTGGGVRAGEFTISWDNRYLTLMSATRAPGTLLNGYGSFSYGVQSVGTQSTAIVDFAGTTDLAGTGPLFHLNFMTGTTFFGSPVVTLASALFNETLPALRANGFVTIPFPSSFSVNPYDVTLLAGQTQQMTLSGTTVPPIIWSTLDNAVATISPGGLVTAVAGGVTKAQAVDNTGGTSLNNSINVYDFALTIGTVTVPPGAMAHVPLNVDRNLAPLGVYGVEYTFGWSPTWVTSVTFPTSGLFSQWSAPLANPTANNARVVSAGATALSGGGALHHADITVSPSTPPGTDIPLTLTSVIFNEGRPIPRITNAVLRVRTTVDAPGEGALGFAMSPAMPNPASGSVRFAFTLPAASGHVSLAVYGADGRRVRTLVDRPLDAGRHEWTWDARAADGSPVAVGVYFARLERDGQQLERRFAVLR